MRALGLDLGSRRVGVAISDRDGRLATPVTTLARGRDHDADHAAIAELVAEYDVEIVVVGVPLSLDGGTGPAARAILDEVDAISSCLRVPVTTVDERFTTIEAEQQLRDAGVRGRNKTKVIDQAAAVVLLQAWLERKTPT